MLRPFEQGIDGILVMACSEDTCRSLEGSRRARMRVREANSVLEEVGLGDCRVMLKQRNGSEPAMYRDALEELVAQTQALGASPTRGNNVT